MSLKQDIEKMREELVKLAEAHEQEKDAQCARALLAASGLKMLESRLHKTAGVFSPTVGHASLGTAGSGIPDFHSYMMYDSLKRAGKSLGENVKKKGLIKGLFTPTR